MSDKPMTKLDVMLEHFRTETMLEPEELEVMADEAEAELARLRSQAELADQVGPLVEALEKVNNGIGMILGLVNGNTLSILNEATGKYERVPKWKAVDTELKAESEAIKQALATVRQSMGAEVDDGK